jgi:pimeloyl-ACP methyl ester carboxylesterase
LATIEASDGTALYVEVHGEPGGRSGECIVFSCAYCTTHENWRPQVGPLVEAGHCVALWDLRGHGSSAAPADAAGYAMDRVVDDLARVCDHAFGAGQRAVLAGLSFGGLVSLHLACRDPQRVRALVLAGSGPGFKKPEAAKAWAERTERTARYLEERGLDAFVSGKAGATCVGRDPELPAARAAGDAIRRQDVAALAAFGRGATALAPSVIDELAGISAPALVIVGEQDEAFRRAAEVMAAKLPNAEHQCLANAGHILNIEQAEPFTGAVLEFLSRLSG